MKTKWFLFFLMLFITIPVCADVKESREKKPFIPVSRNTAYAVASGLAISNNSAFIPTSTLVSMTDFDSAAQLPRALNIYKGDLAEIMMDRVFTSKTLKMTGNWQMLSPANVGRNGIDGLYIRMDSRGILFAARGCLQYRDRHDCCRVVCRHTCGNDGHRDDLWNHCFGNGDLLA